ncbi:MAG: serine hydrolase, partial [Gemmatimonadales bacterium]|nr:serine hydrolase [Gemmatimonadales bacterium]
RAPTPSEAQTPAADSVRGFASLVDSVVPAVLDRVGVVPGVALAVVKGNETVYAKGFGMADREAGLSATAETDFYIASVTKPFTALATAILDHRGELDLDASMARYFPAVEFDPEVHADSVTLRHLLSHTAGIQNDAIVFRTAFSGEHTPEVLTRVLASTTPQRRARRGNFRYTNLGYNIASMVLDKETGRRWQDLLRELVFEPAGLQRTTAYASLPRRDGWPTARPYMGFGPNGLERVYLEKKDNTMQAAGGLYSTAEDLARWVIIQLNEGRIDGKQVFPADLIRETQALEAETEGSFGPFGRTGYGLGWYHGTYKGERLMHHFGGFAGAHSHVSFMPDHALGVVVLVNESSAGTRLAGFLAGLAYEWWLGKPNMDSVLTSGLEGLLAEKSRLEERIITGRANRAKRTWQLTAPLDAYTGTYVSPLYGTAVVTIEDQRLAVRIGNIHAVSTPFTQPNTIRVELLPGRGQVVGFELGEDGKAVRARIDDQAVFERVGE